MPKRFTGKLCGFLFDHLERCTFGDRLRWVDRTSGVFQIFWRHGNGASATPEEDCAVFMEWHRYKNRRSQECAALDAKQRFRAALNKMKLDVVKKWESEVPEKNFQYRRFPKEDLEYLLKKEDQRVPASPAVSGDDVSETESQPASPHVLSSPDADSEPTSSDSFQSAGSEPLATQLTSPAVKSPEDWWQPLMDVRHSYMTPLGSEAPYRLLTGDEMEDMFYTYNNDENADKGSLGGLAHSDVLLCTDETLPHDDTIDEKLLDDPYVGELLLMDENTLVSTLGDNLIL
ncbi:uncharacterized protein LOC119463715 [Dermacentor silvarum]|uniref:uncharacterized protein LOC119463715 n=1 Tax=Dermacentor silvarum TaxID=543639 RepID=UPI002101150E|nr:uncharacterized protein LOC119463715 [Dermacentor silvarum]